MSAEMLRQIEELKRMSTGELRAKYSEVFGEPTRAANRDWLWKRIAWRMQELKYGGLSERAQRRATELVNEADLRIRPPRGTFDNHAPEEAAPAEGRPLKTKIDHRLPMPGTVLTRKYQGRTVAVTIYESGFEHDGKMYRSLSAAVRAITGTQWNGFLFFREALNK